ncbi:hypothetical protein EVAR_12058_1 [Eumeta japonica]|uniref:Uncharacterized protein n=1 Tax=Eumeta variegata TaxID=151549 RepID=A0A4C1U5R4_EUMVA|nr:hypothetical protein EVAR_12058_1 [Eumeta japonica]
MIDAECGGWNSSTASSVRRINTTGGQLPTSQRRRPARQTAAGPRQWTPLDPDPVARPAPAPSARFISL